MADCCGFLFFVSDAPRGASGVFFKPNILLVKYFSKTGHGKRGGRVQGWNKIVL
jgi:hypothetical protein